MNHSNATANALIEASENLRYSLAWAGYNSDVDMTRIVIRFPDTRTLYRYTRELRQSDLVGFEYNVNPAKKWPDYRRDENGYIFLDLVINGIPWRFTSDELTQGYYVEQIALPEKLEERGPDEDAPIAIDVITVPPCEPGVKRCG